MSPKVSVIMATYCRVALIERAIKSILFQTFSNFELIILDDGSTDGTQDIIKRYAKLDDRIRYIRFEENSGTPAFRYNQGMVLARASYVSYMFDDDELYPEALETLYNFMQENLQCGMVYGLADYYDTLKQSYIGKGFGSEWDYQKLVTTGNFLCNLSVMVKKCAIDEVGGYDESPVIKRLCDWDLWVRIGEKYLVKRIPKVVGKVYASYEDSIGATVPLNISNIRDHQEERTDVVLKHYWKQKKKILFVTHGHDEVLQRWRIDYLVTSINSLGGRWLASKVDRSDPTFHNKFKDVHVVVLYRFNREDTMVEFSGKKIIYDIDDFVFQENCKHATPFQIKNVKTWLQKADMITVASKELLNQIEYKDKMVLRKNAINIRDFINIPYTKKIKSERMRIGWMGGFGRNENNDFVIELLTKLSKILPVTFIYFGKTEKFYDTIKAIPNLMVERNSYVPFSQPEIFYKIILNSNLDCIINPLKDDLFYKCKSELKYIEAAALRIPLITSSSGMFGEIIKNGENGYLADTVEEYLNFIEEIRCGNKVTDNAYADVKLNYSIDTIRDKFILQLDDLVKDQIEFPKEKYKIGPNVDKGNSLVGEIHENTTVKQTFKGEHSNLTRLQFMAATFGRKNIGTLCVDLIEDTKCVRSFQIKCSDIIDNDYVDFLFEPIQRSKGKQYTIIFTAPECRVGNAVTIYVNKATRQDGLVVNKKNVAGALCFKVYYLNL